MVTRHTRGKITWVDLESPSHEELDSVMREFNIDERIEEEIIAPTPYPIVISFPKYQYLILHFPTTDPAGGTRTQEVDFIVGKHFIITARYEIIETLHNLHRVFEAEELLGLPHATAHADELLERLMRRMYGAIREEMEHAARVLDRIETDMFAGKERDTVHGISDVGRVLLRFQTTLARHQEPLAQFLQGLTAPAFFGKKFSEHAAHIEGEREHVADLVRSYRAAATELRATNDSLLNASQNEIVKRLTVVAFLVTPMTVLSSLFNMNFRALPFQEDPHAFWIIVVLGLLVSLTAFVFFKSRKWL
ncbi:MAG: Magnesium transporter [Parcubacteria group bacterium]|nr:Magnesium transporter [Parcubacteria group bacterium]